MLQCFSMGYREGKLLKQTWNLEVKAGETTLSRQDRGGYKLKVKTDFVLHAREY